jgi:hypothetical protein
MTNHNDLKRPLARKKLDDEGSGDGDRMDLDTETNDFGDAAGWGQPESSERSENRATEGRERTPLVREP